VIRGLVLVALAACTTGYLDPLPPPPVARPADARPADARPADAPPAPRMKVEIMVPYPEPCPAIAAPTGDPHALAARGTSANLGVDIDGFARVDLGVPEAVALLGQPVLCNHDPKSRYADYYLAPVLDAERYVRLELHDDELIGIIVDVDPPVVVDITALRARFGKGRFVRPPEDSFEAGGEAFELSTPDVDARFAFSHRDHGDPDDAWRVHQIIFRRHAKASSLPATYSHADDVARLIAFVLHRHARDPIDFVNALDARRNVAKAHVAEADHTVHGVHAKFKQPITATPTEVVDELARLLRVPPPMLTANASVARIVVAGRGIATLGLANGAIETIEIERQ
jgi:hypothetical protein